MFRLGRNALLIRKTAKKTWREGIVHCISTVVHDGFGKPAFLFQRLNASLSSAVMRSHK